MTQRVSLVETVKCCVSGKKLVVCAYGFVNTAGWSDGKLVPGVKIPNSGIVSFDLVGTPPDDDPVIQVITPVIGQAIIDLEEWITGVGVAAERNEIVNRFHQDFSKC